MSKKTISQRKPAYKHLPVKVSRKNFNQYILPLLSLGKRGPKPNISLYKIFNYILYVLHTGIQWQELKPYKNEIHWSRVYAKHNRWSKDGSYQRLFEASVIQLNKKRMLNLSILHGDGSNTVAKKGVKGLDTQDINIKKVKKNLR